ncbi:MAG: ATP-grasp domain-containing protein, partial [Firmicutes bacterium]|nr:ATP-grasp domain-containing protein [Bacillota bacterium]
MKNFVFISPNFPTNYWKFCRQLKDNGLNVLGIGDQPYDELKWELKDSLTEYYKVSSMENYDEVYRAVAFFIHKYGRIDWLESNNEYWLVRDAQLRTDFNITTGFQAKDMEPVKYKSKMKENFIKAGLPVARYHIVDNLENCREFLKKVGYPAVAKPDNGVGAEATYKLKCDEDLVNFIESYDKNVSYIMEEYVNATVNSYDAIIDSNGEPIFENGNVTVLSLMDVVNDLGNSIYYQQKQLPDDIVKAGRASVKAFGVKSRFIHFEYFRLTQDQEGLGKEG